MRSPARRTVYGGVAPGMCTVYVVPAYYSRRWFSMSVGMGDFEARLTGIENY